MSSLTHRGYGLLKDAFPPNELEELRKALTVKPFNSQCEQKPFRVYCESSKKLYIPKAFGLAAYGAPEDIRLSDGEDIDVSFAGSLRPEQKAPVEAFLGAAKDPNRMGGIINLVCGQGKCLARDTPVLMADGSVKPVQDIIPGEQVMGDDSAPRVVLSTCCGEEGMFEIQDTASGETYTVNASHVLSLIDMTTYKKYDIPLPEYLRLPARKKQELFGYRAVVEWPNGASPLECYKVGYGFGMTTVGTVQGHIDVGALLSPRISQLSLLQGIVDACGVRNESLATVQLNTCHPQVVFLLRSLGFVVHKKGATVAFSSKVFDDMIERSWVPRPFDLAYPITVTPVGMGEYYGFELGGGPNRRFMLGDFTVTHNTVCALYIIAQLGKKAMIVVHKDFLLNQWRERIAEFLPTARVGLIKAKDCEINDKDIVIGSLQSLSMKDYDHTTFASFGLLCVDECHRTGAEVFSRLYRKVNTRYSLGLSATVNRKDGLTKVFKWHIGDIVYRGGKRDDIVLVHLKEFDHASPEYRQECLMYNGKPNMSKMINNVCAFGPRIEFVVELVTAALEKEPTRKVLVLSDRRKHLEDLKGALDKAGVGCGFYYGGMKPDELKVSEGKQVLLATFAFCAEGLDVAKLDTLVLASPKSDVIQSVGRILREKEANRVNVPTVYDIIDNFGMFPSQAQKRIKYYKSQRYKIIKDGADVAQPEEKRQVVTLTGPRFVEED